jgi:hypothetical protein
VFGYWDRASGQVDGHRLDSDQEKTWRLVTASWVPYRHHGWHPWCWLRQFPDELLHPVHYRGLGGYFFGIFSDIHPSLTYMVARSTIDGPWLLM